MKAALALLATLFCMEAAAQWTVVEEVNDLDSESQIVAMSPITYGEPYGASRTAIRCTSSKMLEMYFSFKYLDRKSIDTQMALEFDAKKKFAVCNIETSTRDRSLFITNTNESCNQFDRYIARQYVELDHSGYFLFDGWWAAPDGRAPLGGDEDAPPLERLERLTQRLLSVAENHHVGLRALALAERPPIAATFEYVNGGAVTIEYDMDGAKEAIHEVLGACNGHPRAHP